MYVYKSAAESGVTNTAYRVISLVAQDHAVAEGGEAPVSACKPLCARLGAGVACVPDFIRESERGPFVPEVLKPVWPMHWKH